jgi:class 3 adenylate cyclase
VWTPDFPWGIKPGYVAEETRALERWGTNEYGAAWARAEVTEGNVVPDDSVRLAGLLSRHTATPDVALELARIWHDTDVRGVLPSVQAPALLLTRSTHPDGVAVSEYVASLMPDARVEVLPSDYSPEGMGQWLDSIRRFVGAEIPPIGLETVLSTVLFTDIVGSTEMQASLGDLAWKGLVERHHATVREALERWRGVENDTAGDGFYATFDGPARAIRCAQDVIRYVRDLGLEIRAGLHTGECELIDDKIGGITVSIGARIASLARPSEVLISQTVKDLVAGSGLTFQDAGEYELKGVPNRWHLHRVVGP